MLNLLYEPAEEFQVSEDLKRRRGEQRIPIIVSNDPCFDQNLHSLREYDIGCISVDDLIKQIHEC